MSKPDIDELTGARAELLCFLVATVAASYALTQEWRVDHLVESCRIWLKRNLVTMNWLDVSALANWRSRSLAVI